MATASVNTKTGEVRREKGGEPLAVRALAAHIVGDRNGQEYRLCRETALANGGEVWGVYKGHAKTPDYAIDVAPSTDGERVVHHCNCPDCQCRQKTCKHMIHLAVRLGYAVRLRNGAIVGPASRLLTRPLSQIELVSAFAAEVEAREQRPVLHAGSDCPHCGRAKLESDWESGSGIRGTWLECPHCLTSFRPAND